MTFAVIHLNALCEVFSACAALEYVNIICNATFAVDVLEKFGLIVLATKFDLNCQF